MAKRKDILVTTTSRILKFWEISNYISYNVQTFDDKIIININDVLDCPIGKKSINRYHLNGLTFYCNNSKPHNIVLKISYVNQYQTPQMKQVKSLYLFHGKN